MISLLRTPGSSCLMLSTADCIAGMRSTPSRSPATNIAGWRIAAWMNGESSSQLRWMLRYQLKPPRNPLRRKSAAYSARSCSLSQANGMSASSALSSSPPPGAANLQRVEKPEHVADDVDLGIGLDRSGSIAAAVAAHVGRKGTETRLRQHRQLMPPRIPGLRPAVAEHDRGPLAHFRHMQAD